MNFLKLSFLLVFAISLVACGSDDDAGSCTQADWVGIYTGSSDCGAGPEDVTVTVTAEGTNAIVIESDGDGTIQLDSDPIEFNGCRADDSLTDSGITFDFDADLDGDNLTVSTEISGGSSFDSECTFTVTRM